MKNGLWKNDRDRIFLKCGDRKMEKIKRTDTGRNGKVLSRLKEGKLGGIYNERGKYNNDCSGEG